MKIPVDIDAAVGRLNGLDALVTASEWERAAIVYAFTTDKEGRPSKTAGNPAVFSLTKFADLGIVGLVDRGTVAYYRQVWEHHGADIGPGDEYQLPSIPWKDREVKRPDTNFGKRPSAEKAVEAVEDWSPEAKQAVGRALAQDEEAQGAIIETISDDHGLTAQVDDAWDRKNPRKQPVKSPGAVVSIMEVGVHTAVCDDLVKEGKAIPSALMGVGSVEPGTPIHDVLVLYRSALQRARQTIDNLEPLVAAMLGDGPTTAEAALAEWSNS